MDPATDHAGRRDRETTEIRARQRRLLAWYDAHARDLPWRRRPSLYGTWIAEVMLQQTTVAAVIPRWQEFLDRFPDVHALAAAEESEVLATWSGLGYYRRARLLHRAGREVLARHGGRLPRSLAGWRELPGIGEYAAGAIASIGLGLPTPAVDANARRVLTRWTCATPAAARQLGAAGLRDLAAAHVPTGRPGDWNQAVMDLGAGRCRAGEPDCVDCPVHEFCAAGRAGTAVGVPPAVPRGTSTPVVLGGLVVRAGEQVLLAASERSVVARVQGLGRPRRADLGGLFVGMLGLPLTPWYPAVGTIDAARLIAAWRRWLRTIKAPCDAVEARGWIRHAITVYRLQVLVCETRWDRPCGVAGLPGAVWAAWPPADQPVSTLARKILRRASLAGSDP